MSYDINEPQLEVTTHFNDILKFLNEKGIEDFDTAFEILLKTMCLIQGQNADFLMFDFEHGQEYQKINPLIEELSEISDAFLIEYYFDELLENTNDYFRELLNETIKRNEAKGEVDSFVMQRIQASKVISEFAKEREKTVFAVDRANNFRFEIAYQIAKAIPVSYVMLLGGAASFTAAPDDILLPVMMVALGGLVFLQFTKAVTEHFTNTGAYSKTSVSEHEMLNFDLDLVRRVDLAKGINEIDKKTEKNPNGEKKTVLVLYPRSHLLRAAKYAEEKLEFDFYDGFMIAYYDLVSKLFGVSPELRVWDNAKNSEEA